MKLFKYFCLLSFMASCSSEQTPQELLSVDLRSGMDHPSMLALQDEIESVEYIPLETTADPASLLDGVSEYAVTSNYIYVSPVKEQRIVQFDRKGQFVKTLIPFGQGPGEFSDFLMGMQADEKNNRLYLFCSNKIMVYTLDGEFIQSLNHDYTIVYQRMVGKDRFASVAFPYVPFESGSYGLGVFSDKADTIAMKNDFSSPLVSHEKAGFTIALATGGMPAFTRLLKKQLEHILTPELADFNSFLLLQREAVKNIESTPQERTQFWRSVLKQDLLNLVIAGEAAQAKEKVLDAVNSFRTQSQNRPR